MDKTEKRTAEEMYSNVVGRPGIHKDLPLHINATGEYLRKDIVLTAMQEYAAQERDKARNQAIQDCIAHVHGYCNATTADTLVKKLESIKTKQ